jgi:hypothetical protein
LSGTSYQLMLELCFIGTLLDRLDKSLSSLIRKAGSIEGYLHFEKDLKDFHLQLLHVIYLISLIY